VKNELIVDWFQMEQKRERRERFLRLVGVSLLAMIAVSFGQNAAVGEFNNSLTNSIAAIYPYIKVGVSAILFIFFLAKAIPAVMGNDKETNWWALLGIIGAIALINVAPSIYDAIAGTNFEAKVK
jgi:hypothetical protein